MCSIYLTTILRLTACFLSKTSFQVYVKTAFLILTLLKISASDNAALNNVCLLTIFKQMLFSDLLSVFVLRSASILQLKDSTYLLHVFKHLLMLMSFSPILLQEEVQAKCCCHYYDWLLLEKLLHFIDLCSSSRQLKNPTAVCASSCCSLCASWAFVFLLHCLWMSSRFLHWLVTKWAT